MNLNNSAQTFYISDGAYLYDVVEGSPRASWSPAARWDSGPRRVARPADHAARAYPVVSLGGDNTLLTQNDEVQELYVNNSVTSFTLTYNGQTTGSIANYATITSSGSPSSTALAIQSQLQAWFGAGNVNVSQTVSGNQTLFLLTFVGQDAGTSMAPVQLGALTGASYSEACTIAFPYQPFAGSWTISYNNGTTTQTTGTLAASATPTQVASALNGLSNLGTGAVSVTTSGNAYTYAITFNAGYSTNLGNFVVNTSSLEPTLIPTISVTTGSGSAINVLGSAGTNSVQQITLDNSVTGFEIAYDSLVTGSVANNTANPTTTAAAIQAALGALSGIGVNNVVAIASSTTSSQTVYTVSFKNMLGGANIGQIGLTAITGATYANTVETITQPPRGGRPAQRQLDDHLQ